jgi:hypothetical protein
MKKVERWISYEKASDGMPESLLGGPGGFFNGFASGGGMRWKDYLDGGEEWREYAEALRAEVLRLGLRKDGAWHQGDDEGVPVFDDGTVALFSFRAWGDFLAAVWSEHDGLDYNYMDFYCCDGGDGTTKEQALKYAAHRDAWAGRVSG